MEVGEAPAQLHPSPREPRAVVPYSTRSYPNARGRTLSRQVVPWRGSKVRPRGVAYDRTRGSTTARLYVRPGKTAYDRMEPVAHDDEAVRAPEHSGPHRPAVRSGERAPHRGCITAGFSNTDRRKTASEVVSTPGLTGQRRGPTARNPAARDCRACRTQAGPMRTPVRAPAATHGEHPGPPGPIARRGHVRTRCKGAAYRYQQQRKNPEYQQSVLHVPAGSKPCNRLGHPNAKTNPTGERCGASRHPLRARQRTAPPEARRIPGTTPDALTPRDRRPAPRRPRRERAPNSRISPPRTRRTSKRPPLPIEPCSLETRTAKFW